jgi:hypothetical protein
MSSDCTHEFTRIFTCALMRCCSCAFPRLCFRAYLHAQFHEDAHAHMIRSWETHVLAHAHALMLRLTLMPARNGILTSCAYSNAHTNEHAHVIMITRECTRLPMYTLTCSHLYTHGYAHTRKPTLTHSRSIPPTRAFPCVHTFHRANSHDRCDAVVHTHSQSAPMRSPTRFELTLALTSMHLPTHTDIRGQ